MHLEALTVHNFRSLAQVRVALGDYSLLVGANNSGKTNIIDAIRVFYDRVKYDAKRDFPKFPTDDKEVWIDADFRLTNDEYNNLKDEYRLPDNRLSVRKFVATEQEGADGKPKLGIYAYVGEDIADEHFYGAKNVQQGKLGDVIYIPAVSRLDEHTKMSGPSALRDMVNEILKKLVKSSASFQALTEQLQTFEAAFKDEETEDNRSLSKLEGDINADLAEWDSAFEFEINAINENDIVKNLLSYKIVDRLLNDRLEPASFGQGFQRHLIFTLIRLAARYQETKKPGKKKEFAPDMTLILFEEPEAYLHPTQQTVLARSLRTIGNQDGHGILISTHSPQFVSQNCDDLPSLIRLCRNGAQTAVGQLSEDVLATVFASNTEINDILSGTKYQAHADDYRQDMEAVKYFLWLNPERCGAFFARHVVLVEGATERALFNYLLETEEVDTPRGGVFVLDCMGKFNLHRFMNLLEPMNVSHAVIFDADNEKPPHDALGAFVNKSRNSKTTVVESFPDNLETFLGIEVTTPHRKPQHVMLNVKNDNVATDKMDALKVLLRRLVKVADVPAE